MIAPKDSTADTMRNALAFTIAALTAAAELDIDRSADDRAFFAAEKDSLDQHFQAVSAAQQAALNHRLLTTLVAQARVQLGDAILDRGVSNAKARMKLELKSSSMPDGADHVFGVDVSEITSAERAKEPHLVLQAVAKFNQVPAFTGKDDLATDLTLRATHQTNNFTARNAATLTGQTLASAEDLAIAAASDALYKLEKRLLERFPRQNVYMKAFFQDVAPSRKSKPSAPEESAPS